MAEPTGAVNGDGVAVDGLIASPIKVGPESPLVDEHSSPLKVAIVGAGIGGLSAALGLRRNGHEVEVRRPYLLNSAVCTDSNGCRFMNNPGLPMKLAQQYTWPRIRTEYYGDGAYLQRRLARRQCSI